MLDREELKAAIARVRFGPDRNPLQGKGFHGWFQQYKDVRERAMSPDSDIRAGAFQELADIYRQEGKTVITNSFSDLVHLHLALATAENTTVGQKFFHENDAIGRGITLIQSGIGEVISEYLGFKAQITGREALPPSDISMPVGDWGTENIPWDEKQSIAVEVQKPLGLDDIAQTIIDGHQGKGAQKAWNDMMAWIEDARGLTGPRMAAHELAHSVHFALADTTNIHPDVSEIVSTFAEAQFVKHMEEKANTPDKRMAILSNQLDSDILMAEYAAKVTFEKNAFAWAEEHPHEIIPVTELWRDANRDFFGDKVNNSNEHEAQIDARLLQWNHYMHQSGYSSSYVIGWAAAPKLMAEMEKNPETFQSKFKELLSKGNNITPEKFLQEFGIDINVPSFWTDRLETMSQDIEQLKQIKKELEPAPPGTSPSNPTAKQVFPEQNQQRGRY